MDADLEDVAERTAKIAADEFSPATLREMEGLDDGLNTAGEETSTNEIIGWNAFMDLSLHCGAKDRRVTFQAPRAAAWWLSAGAVRGGMVGKTVRVTSPSRSRPRSVEREHALRDALDGAAYLVEPHRAFRQKPYDEHRPFVADARKHRREQGGNGQGHCCYPVSNLCLLARRLISIQLCSGYKCDRKVVSMNRPP